MVAYGAIGGVAVGEVEAEEEDASFDESRRRKFLWLMRSAPRCKAGGAVDE